MAQTYTRQSSFADGDTITAALFNDEYNQLVNAFAYSSSSASSTGHRHDGTAGQGGNIPQIGDLDFLNKIVVDDTNNRWGFYVEVSSAAVEQIRLQDGALLPVTDSDVDLGTSSLYFKDAYIDSITTTGNVAVGGNLTVTGTTTFNGGTLTLGDAADDNVVFGADVNSNIIPNTDNTYDLGSSSQEWKDLYIDGVAYLDGINFNGTAITSTAAELNILDGVTATAAELNLLDGVTATTAELNIVDGDTSATSTTLADADRVIVNDNGTMVQVALTDFETYFESALDTLSNVTTVGALNAGSITSGFGAIDNGSSAITTTGTVTYGSLSDGTITITAFVDEDNMASDSATLVPTQQSVKAYVDAQVATANELSELTDVNITTPADASLLFYDTTTAKWIDNVVSGDITIADTGVATIQANSVALGTDTTGDYVGTVTAGTGLTSTGATSGEGIAHSLSVDASQTQITAVGTLTTGTWNATSIADAYVDNNLTISGGTVDNSVIGGTTPAAGTFTTLTANTSITGTLATAAQTNITSLGTLTGLTTSGDINFGDNDKAVFGAGSDLQLYHSGTNSLIDNNTGGLYIRNNVASDVGGDIFIQAKSGENSATFTHDGAVTLMHDNVTKFATTSSGIDVTGTVELDNITVSGAQGSDGQVLTSTGSGIAWEDVGAASSVTFKSEGTNFTGSLIVGHDTTGTLSSAENNTALGLTALDAITSGDDNTAIGYGALSAATTGHSNTAIGKNAGLLLTTGSENVFVGERSGDALTEGTNNTGVGHKALSSATTAVSNDAFGNDALQALTTGTKNVAIGSFTLDALTTADNNTAVGYQALSANTTGDRNVAVGTEALAVATTAIRNTVVGFKAGDAVTTGSNNTVLGWQALGSNTTGASNVAIGDTALNANTTASNNTAVGLSALAANTTGTENVAVGSNALTANTTASGNNAVGRSALNANTTGASNVAMGQQALTTNTTGSNNTAIGHVALGDNTTASNNTAMGYLALNANTTGNSNIAVGANALDANTTGARNVAVGYNSLGVNTTASNNTAVGNACLDANTTGANNTAVGRNCLTGNTEGNTNTAVGSEAAQSITTGDENVAIGHGALDGGTTVNGNTAVGTDTMGSASYSGSYNTAFGYNALLVSTSGSGLTAIGNQALDANTTGSNNTAVGAAALGASTTGTDNTAVGVQALKTATTATRNSAFGMDSLQACTTGSYNTGIGQRALYASTTGTENVAMGYVAMDSTTTGSYNVGIGVNALGVHTIGHRSTAIGTQAGFNLTTGSNNFFVGYNTGTSASPGGSITTGSNEGVLGNNEVSKINTQVSITVASDERDKTDFQPLSAGLDFVNELTPYTYYWDKRAKYVDWDANPDTDLNTIEHDGTHKEDWMDIGFKAQDVVALEESIGHVISDKTNLVSNLTGDGKQYQLQYEKFVPILVKAIQELSAKVEELESKLNGE